MLNEALFDANQTPVIVLTYSFKITDYSGIAFSVRHRYYFHHYWDRVPEGVAS